MLIAITRPVHRLLFRARLATSIAMRFIRLLAYGFELVLLSKLFAGRSFRGPVDVTSALLKTKSVQHLPPGLTVSGPAGPIGRWSEGFAAVNAALFLNLRNPDALSASRYAHPAPSFRAIYLWDSAFIAQIWKWWDPEVAWDVLCSVVELRDGDRLQHFVAEITSSKLTQPPLLAWSLVQLGHVAEAERFQVWVEALYDPLRAYHYWLFAHRQLPNGLFAWAHPYESGVDNAPRFSSRDERRLDDTRWLAAPDFCAYMVLKCEALAAMARRLGREDEAAAHEDEAAALRAAVNLHLWDDAEGLYFDRDLRSGVFVRSRTIASLLPLWGGIPDLQRAHRLRAHILEPTAFNTVIRLPSVALSDKAFGRDMWRGPVWLNTAFAVIAGLRRYGFHDAAADLAFRLCDGVYRTFEHTGRLHEFYDPERHDIEQLHRKRGNRWKRLTLGPRPVSDFVGWSGLVNTLVIEVLFGLRHTARGLIMQPRLPPQAEGLSFTLSLPRDGLSIELEVLANGAVCGHSAGRDSGSRFEAAFGDTVILRPARSS
jgi:hypothetical protein